MFPTIVSWRPIWSMYRLNCELVNLYKFIINCICCSVHCCCGFEGLAPPMLNPSYPAVSALHALDQKEHCWAVADSVATSPLSSTVYGRPWSGSGLLRRIHTCQLHHLHPALQMPSISWIAIQLEQQHSWNCVRSLLPADARVDFLFQMIRLHPAAYRHTKVAGMQQGLMLEEKSLRAATPASHSVHFRGPWTIL